MTEEPYNGEESENRDVIQQKISNLLSNKTLADFVQNNPLADMLRQTCSVKNRF